MSNGKKEIIVVSVIDDYKIAINVGSEHGISKNDKFLIYSLSKDDIFDPITEENLGKLEIVKGIGKVTHIQEKMSTLESASFVKSQEKKTVKTKNPFSFGTQEEILEDLQPTQLPFDNVEVRDYAKPIS